MMILSSVVTQIYPFFAVKQYGDRKASVTGVTSVSGVCNTETVCYKLTCSLRLIHQQLIPLSMHINDLNSRIIF